jgi:hypothetical protein
MEAIWFVCSRAVVMHALSHVIFGLRQTRQDRF